MMGGIKSLVLRKTDDGGIKSRVLRKIKSDDGGDQESCIKKD